jgi:hypothetical protein
VKAEEYTRRQLELEGWPIVVEAYKAGDVYHTTVSNVDPGARFARADGSTRQEAETLALERAARHLAQTRRFPISG